MQSHSARRAGDYIPDEPIVYCLWAVRVLARVVVVVGRHVDLLGYCTACEGTWEKLLERQGAVAACQKRATSVLDRVLLLMAVPGELEVLP